MVIQVKFEIFRKRQLNQRSWKTGKGHRKSHGKSWNLKNSSLEYEPYPSSNLALKTDSQVDQWISLVPADIR